MTINDTIYTALKAAAWEEAKGKLRALVAIQGSIPSRNVTDTETPRWEELSARVEAFIGDVEDNALQE